MEHRVTTETRLVSTFWFRCFHRLMQLVLLQAHFKRTTDSWVYPAPETTLCYFTQRALDLRIGCCCDINLQHTYSYLKRSVRQGLSEFRDSDSEARWESGKGREEERGHLLWPRQGINKQTACQAISTHSEQTGRLTNLPHIYGTEPGITQVKKVRCRNNTWVVLMRRANLYHFIHIITSLTPRL